MSSISQPAPAPTAEQKITVAPNFSPTERQVAETWNRYGGLLQTRADELGVDPGLSLAVLTVESGGHAFGPDRRMTIRFENHVFFDQWGSQNPDRYAAHFRFDPSQRWDKHGWRPAPDQPWRDVHKNQNSEWAVFEFACTLDDTAAKLSISMGGFQIMGFNYKAVGYTAVQPMFDAFAASASNQVDGFFNFVRSQDALRMLQRPPDFSEFARLYNPVHADEYERRLREKYQVYCRLRPSPPVPPGVPRRPAPARSLMDLISRIMKQLFRR